MDIINFLESKMMECKQKGYATNYYIAMDIANKDIEKKLSIEGGKLGNGIV